MADRKDELARMTDAEQWLCISVGPAIDAVVELIESKLGVTIREFRVSLDSADRRDGLPGANCTIVEADIAELGNVHSSGDSAFRSLPHRLTGFEAESNS